MTQDYLAFSEKWRPEVESVLDRLLPPESSDPPELAKAMRHSVLGGGKRVRAMLVLLACEVCGGLEKDALVAAAAIECVHAYSLVHDDLPAMDDDDLRRGKPTCHKVFGEAFAILAGDALLTIAFEIITKEYRSDVAAPLTAVLARAAGATGMVGGQALDILSEGEPLAGNSLRERVEAIHERKTAALISAAAEMGAVVARAKKEDRDTLAEFGRLTGRAFQAIDDVLDETSSSEEMGKATGKDRDRGKLTLPVAISLEAARDEAGRLGNEALGTLRALTGDATLLADLTKLLIKRKS